MSIHKLEINYSQTALKSNDNRSYTLKAFHFVASLFRQAVYSLNLVYHRRTLKNRQHCGQNIKYFPNTEGLVVLLHGLRNDPAAWHAQLSLLSKERKISVFAPVVPNRGMCSLNEAATPILPTILDYIAKNPGKPVCLLGVSNGSRIATWLEIKLRHQAPLTPVMVSTIAGVHLGSSRMDLLKKLRLANHFYPEVLGKELAYCSLHAINLLKEVRAPLPDHCAQRKYEFYATTEDISVPDLNSSLPRIDKGERHYIVHGQSHDSIVSAVSKNQIASCLAWIRKRI